MSFIKKSLFLLFVVFVFCLDASTAQNHNLAYGFDGFVDRNYLIVIAVCVVVLLALMYLRRRVWRSNSRLIDGKIVSVTPLDGKNSLILLLANGEHYILFSNGNSVVLLDKVKNKNENFPSMLSRSSKNLIDKDKKVSK